MDDIDNGCIPLRCFAPAMVCSVLIHTIFNFINILLSVTHKPAAAVAVTMCVQVCEDDEVLVTAVRGSEG